MVGTWADVLAAVLQETGKIRHVWNQENIADDSIVFGG